MSDSNSTTTPAPNVTVHVDSGAKQIIRIVGTVGLCGFVGFVSYAFAQRGWLEIAATVVTAFLFQFVRMMIQNGLLDIERFTSRSVASTDFERSRGLIKTLAQEFVVWQAKSTQLRLAALALTYAILFVLVRQLVSIGLTVFSNQWVAIGVACLLGAIIIAPGVIADLFRTLKGNKGDAK